MLPDIYVFYPPLVWRVLLYAVWFSALAFGAYAAASYDNMNFLGLSQINNYMMNKEKNFNPHGDLTMKGALRYVRHPYYFVALVLIWSRPLKEKDLVLNAVLTVYFILGTLNEERKLRKHFGKEYEEYAKKVPMLIPFLNRLF
jgi:protein-S-isoprenylcysteine O-methyltransferase Ste14